MVQVYRSLLPPSSFDLQARLAVANSNDPQVWHWLLDNNLDETERDFSEIVLEFTLVLGQSITYRRSFL